MICTALALGLHLGTYHFDRDADFREVNPGIYARCDSLIAGVYTNSEDRTTIYAGKVFQLHPNVSVTAGLAAGYTERGLTPIVGLTGHLGHARITLLPPFRAHKGGIHFAWEF